VRNGRIPVVGSLGTVTRALGDEPSEIDETLRDLVVLPGLIDQHLHPLLGATTLAIEVIATEDWVLPAGWWTRVATSPETGRSQPSGWSEHLVGAAAVVGGEVSQRSFAVAQERGSVHQRQRRRREVGQPLDGRHRGWGE
jgi:hypothetical protein